MAWNFTRNDFSFGIHKYHSFEKWHLCHKEMILLMEEILHRLLSMKPYEKRDIIHINWCRISSINSIYATNHDPSLDAGRVVEPFQPRPAATSLLASNVPSPIAAAWLFDLVYVGYLLGHSQRWTILKTRWGGQKNKGGRVKKNKVGGQKNKGPILCPFCEKSVKTGWKWPYRTIIGCVLWGK